MDQIKKEPEPAPEAVKPEEKETVKNAQQSAGTKGPPEKRMRLQWREKLLHFWISPVPGKQEILAPLSLYLSSSTETDSGTEIPVTALFVETCHTNVNIGIWAASKKVLSVFILFWMLDSEDGRILQPPEIFTNSYIPYVLFPM